MDRRIFLSPPHMGGKELEYIRQAFDSNYIAPVGPMVDTFEKAFAEVVGIAHAVALSSGTAAMHLAMRNLGVGPGDEVFASTLTFVGSVTPIVFQGARPVFIDADRDTWNLDPDLLADELARCAKNGRLPKAVVPTDLYGQCVDMDRIVSICDHYGVPVISDSAEALGALYKGRHAGVGAAAAVFSFNGNKIITTSGGGMLVSEDGDFIERARFLSQQARDAAPHYEHATIGYNYRMSNILAAIGLGQLECLEARVRRTREIFDYYRTALSEVPGISFMPEAGYGRATRWLTVILIDPEAFGTDREAVRLALEARNIEARPVWKPMHLQPAFVVDADIGSGRQRSNATLRGRYPARAVGGRIAEMLFDHGLCLPSGTAMTRADLDRVIDAVIFCRNL
ncbi:MAG: aminotransferase class I/II-fold pyridoxal phosphate-dependent enzyme [Desulfatitalea sp.]|nr:aminotransferase class I/II-fold pyridoxal phosphate-dependent enzyme [Desulfatitalea sp.]NNK02679.1 aminotransferase class I/II-fold pyridoxal phosphate-dependent enzyme [Desulfatitalea sp.]